MSPSGVRAASNAASSAADGAADRGTATPAPGAVRTVRTMCPMNCHPTLCGMLAEVRNDALLAVRGDPANPDSRGFLCIRGQASREIIGNPLRLTQPLLRDARGGTLRPAGWDEALDRIAAAIAAEPPAATAFWPGHGTFATNYGTRVSAQLMARFANLHGSQFWNPTMICWGLGAFGLALTGPLETHTPEDLAAHAELVLLWGSNFASQPTTAPHVLQARARGAHVVTIDVRHTEAAAKSDEVLLIRPGSDTALALALLHVIVREDRHDPAFVAAHTVGFEALRAHVAPCTPAWAEPLTGLPAARIVALARRYAASHAAMIVLGGSSMHKGDNGWEAARAIACLPAVTGQLGRPGAGFGPRHGAAAHGRGLASIAATERRAPGSAMPNQMAGIGAALREGRIGTLLLLGSNMLSSFADTHALAQGLARTRLTVSYDLFLNDTARQHADVVLPATAWLEEVGVKMTATHLYLMERALPATGQARTVAQVLRPLAQRLGLADFFPWADEEAMIDAVLDHPCTGRATVARLRAAGGHVKLAVGPVAHPDLRFDTPSGRLELLSARAAELGLPALPPLPQPPAASPYPLVLTQGRTLLHFHSFYDNGQALPTLARKESAPQLWVSPADAAARGLAHGDPVRVYNDRGEMTAQAHVTDRTLAGTLWLRDGWAGLNRLTSGAAVLPDAAVDVFSFAAGQARFEARVEVAAVSGTVATGHSASLSAA
ncbi:MAG: molybdopterin-dependent oxidoreductase [Betaproteobacteria bacterium]